MGKITIPRKLAAAIEYYRNLGHSSADIVCVAKDLEVTTSAGRELQKFVASGKENEDKLMRALVLGYKIEHTPEEKLYDVYVDAVIEKSDEPDYYTGKQDGIKQTLKILGIDVKGITSEWSETKCR